MKSKTRKKNKIFAQPIDTKARYLETNVFKIKHGQDVMRVQMRALYNVKDGAAILIRRKGDNHFIVHSVPYPASLPKSEVERIFGLFKQSAIKCDAKAKFKLFDGIPEL